MVAPHRSPTLFREHFLDGDNRLQNLNLNWEDEIAVGPTPGLSPIPDSQHHTGSLSPRELARLNRSSTVFENSSPLRRECHYEAHERLYDHGRIQNANWSSILTQKNAHIVTTAKYAGRAAKPYQNST